MDTSVEETQPAFYLVFLPLSLPVMGEGGRSPQLWAFNPEMSEYGRLEPATQQVAALSHHP